MTTISSTQRLAQLTGNLSQTLSEISSLLTDAAAAPADTEPQEAAQKSPARKKASKSPTSSTPEPKTDSPSAEASSGSSEDKKITMIELRDLLNQKSRDGFTDRVKELILSYGVKKLSQIPEDKYPEVYAAAEKFTKEG
ncbi:hypothetical protein ACKX2D_11130 [Lachnospiraceae bacterium YH-ros2226]